MAKPPSIAKNITLGLGIPALLLALKTLDQLTQQGAHWGQLGESLFQGDRLPNLPFPKTEDTEKPPA